MILTIQPTRRLKGVVQLPASKSYTIRAFMIAACGGQSMIYKASDCDDAQTALSVVKQLGVKVAELDKNSWKLHAGESKTDVRKIQVNESGTVLRLLLPLLSLRNKKITVVGRGTLIGRPNHHLTSLLRSQGVMIHGKGEKESVPIVLAGGQMRGGKMNIDGSMSSQFISALLITCPQLTEDSQIFIKGSKLVSGDYITMTLQVLRQCGIRVQAVHPKLYKIEGRQYFKGLKNFKVPSDYGLAAFLLAAGILTDSDLALKGHFNDRLVQADGRILRFLKKMGVRLTKTRGALKIAGPFPYKGGSFSLKECPDLVPIMSVLALFAKGKTRLYNIGHARVKESDRISDLRKELLKVGAQIIETANDITILPQKEYKKNVLLDPHYDHRLAMAFAVLGLKVGVRIKNMECVSKSYPAFVKDFKTIGVSLAA